MMFIPTDFPEPVVPATRRCGARARSKTFTSPVTSRPIAMGRAAALSRNASLSTSSRADTVERCRFATSRPTQSSSREDITLPVFKATEMSSVRLRMADTLTPFAGNVLYRVTVGPDTASMPATWT